MARQTGRINEGRWLLTKHTDPIITREVFKKSLPKYNAVQIGNLVNSLLIAKDITRTSKKGIYMLGERYISKMKDEKLQGDLSAEQVGTSIIAYIDVLKGTINERDETIDKWRSNVRDLQSTVRELRRKNAELTEENTQLKDAVKTKSGKTLSMEEVATVITKKG